VAVRKQQQQSNVVSSLKKRLSPVATSRKPSQLGNGSRSKKPGITRAHAPHSGPRPVNNSHLRRTTGAHAYHDSSKDYGFVSGTDYVGYLQMYNKGAPGTSSYINRGQLVYEFQVNPLMLGGPSLLLEAKRYQKFRFKKLKFEYEPQVPVTCSGALLTAFVRDPTDRPPLPFGEANLEYCSVRQAVSSLIYDPVVMDWKNEGRRMDEYYEDETWYHMKNTEGDVTDESQGKIYIFAMNNPSLPDDDLVHEIPWGSFFIEYEVEMCGLKSEEAPPERLVPLHMEVQIDPGYPINLNTYTYATEEDQNFPDGDGPIYEVLIEDDYSGVFAENLPPGQVCYLTANKAPSSDRENALGAVVLSLFSSLANLLIGQVLENISTSPISVPTNATKTVCEVLKTALAPSKVAETAELLVRSNIKIAPRWKEIEDRALDAVKKVDVEAAHRYVNTHFSNVIGNQNYYENLPDTEKNAGGLLSPIRPTYSFFTRNQSNLA